MRVTVFKKDNMVAVGGVAHPVDCTRLPGDFHVLQWYGEHGELEFASVLERKDGAPSQWHKKPNQIIDSFDSYRSYVAAWDIVDARLKAEREAAKAAEGNDNAS